MHRGAEPSRLQSLALQLADKVIHNVEITTGVTSTVAKKARYLDFRSIRWGCFIKKEVKLPHSSRPYLCRELLTFESRVNVFFTGCPSCQFCPGDLCVLSCSFKFEFPAHFFRLSIFSFPFYQISSLVDNNERVLENKYPFNYRDRQGTIAMLFLAFKSSNITCWPQDIKIPNDSQIAWVTFFTWLR